MTWWMNNWKKFNKKKITNIEHFTVVFGRKEEKMETMTRERLEQYQSNKAEIKELTHKLNHLGEDGSFITSDVIKDYRKGYGQPQAIRDYDEKLEQKCKMRIEDKLGQLRAEQDNIEEWVFGIRDGLTRRIFRLYFLEGMSQRRVARILHIDQSRVSRKIEDFLKNA